MNLTRLDITNAEVAAAVLSLQRRAYAVEAGLIGSEGIPPLHETLEELQECGETFLGAFAGERLTGAISWRLADRTIDIHRLAVDPDGFRQGIGSSLLRAALAAEPRAERAIVQTGAANLPACALYLGEGFERVDEVDVGGGLIVARFVKHLG